MKIRTNNTPRHLLYGYQLPPEARSDFDWMDDIDSADFVAYRGRFYAVSEFMRVPDEDDGLAGWHGYSPNSFFSGVVIKLSADGESVICGTYLC